MLFVVGWSNFCEKISFQSFFCLAVPRYVLFVYRSEMFMLMSVCVCVFVCFALKYII